MQPFQFGLETLLRIRKRLEERAKNDFLDQQRRVQEQQQMLEGLMAERLRIEEKAKLAAGATVDIVMERGCAEYNQALRYRIEAARQKLKQLTESMERLRDAYIQAQQAVKILDKLKERRYQEYLREARRQEQSFLDEVAVSHFQSARER